MFEIKLNPVVEQEEETDAQDEVQMQPVETEDVAEDVAEDEKPVRPLGLRNGCEQIKNKLWK